MIFFDLLLIFIILSFPLLLWGYGTLYLSQNIWNRNRFLFGMLGWAIAVFVIAIFGKSSVSGSSFLKIGSFILIFSVIGMIAWWATKRGSPFIRWFLRKALFLHSMIFCSVFAWTLLLKWVIPTSNSFLIFLTSIWRFLLAASIEEWVKHVSTLWLTAKEFRFTRRDFLIFTFFVTLWFSTVESAIYLFSHIDSWPWWILFIGISRILFSLTIHVFAASICVMMWWKALSYKMYSYKYIFLFVLGYMIATIIHGAYNILLDRSYIFPLIVLTWVWYFSFSQWMIAHEWE